MTAPSDFPVEEILARCLTEPSFLASLATNPGAALAAYPLDAKTRAAFVNMDMQRVRRFSGFIGKVQHNYLWDFFPAARRLLQRYKVEIEVFAEYRAIQLLPELRAQKQSDKIRRFAAYLSNYAIKRPEFIGLAAAVRYERACWELRKSKAALHAPPPLTAAVAGAATWADFLRLVPTPIGPLRIKSFDCDPARLVASILDETFVGYPTGTDRLFVLQLDPQDSLLRISEVEELPALLLSLIDGKRSVRSVVAAARRRALAATPPQAFRAFFEEAAAAGFIGFHRVSPCA